MKIRDLKEYFKNLNEQEQSIIDTTIDMSPKGSYEAIEPVMTNLKRVIQLKACQGE